MEFWSNFANNLQKQLKNHEFLAIFEKKFFGHQKMHDFSSEKFFLIFAEISAKKSASKLEILENTQKFHLPKDLRLF